MENEKKLQTDVIELPDWQELEDYQESLYTAHKNENPDELEFLLLHRPEKFEGNKIRGEEELLDWLTKSFKEKYGSERKPLVELNKKGIIIPIKLEE